MERPLTKNFRKPGERPPNLSEYQHAGGYQALRKAINELTPAEVIALVKDSGLRGRGGAGFPTGQKWSFVPKLAEAPRPRYLVVNADEMEPGTFKDRFLLEHDPHQLIEGIIVSAYAIQADVAYIFLRAEYVRIEQMLQEAIQEAYAAGFVGRRILGSDFNLELHLHTSAGRYICGEETGLINSLEGRPANPRTKPPHPVVAGLWGKPTVVNNVETLCNVPHIVNNGVEWFKKLSRSSEGGTKIYGVSGKVKRPGAWELPLGTTAREIIFEHAGGLWDGLKLRGFIPGGASTEFLLEEHLDISLDFTAVPKAGSRLGTGTMIVLDDQSCPVGMVANIEKFFARESCGWCTPCREGLPWVARLLEALETGSGTAEDLDLLASQVRLLSPPGNTFCPLALGAVAPLASALKYFKRDFEAHIGCKCSRS